MITLAAIAAACAVFWGAFTLLGCAAFGWPMRVAAIVAAVAFALVFLALALCQVARHPIDDEGGTP